MQNARVLAPLDLGAIMNSQLIRAFQCLATHLSKATLQRVLLQFLHWMVLIHSLDDKNHAQAVSGKPCSPDCARRRAAPLSAEHDRRVNNLLNEIEHTVQCARH
jgi:hypothetical protein